MTTCKAEACLNLAIAAGVAVMCCPLTAAADDTAMKEMVVTATRTPIEAFKAPANISVITRETLEDKHYSDLGAALKDVPGVTIQNYGSSGANYSSNSLLINGSDKIVVLIDGMRANTNGSVSNKFSANELVDMSMVERIEILKGAASTLYGSDAEGGVINIITRRVADDQMSTTLGYTGGSYGLGQYNFRHAGSKEGFYWAITGQKRASSNYKDGSGKTIPEDIDDTTLGVKLGKKFDDGVSSVELDYSQYDSDYMRPNNLGSGIQNPVYGEKHNNRIALAYVQKLSDRLTNRLSAFQNNNNLKDNKNNWASRWFMDLETSGISDQLTFRTDDHVLTGGIDYYRDKVKSYYDMLDSYSEPKTMSSTALFIQDEWTLVPNLTLTPGVRLDRHSIYGSHTSPAVTLNYVANQRTNYYVSYKEYFVAPNQYQLFSKYGNTDLKPEQGHAVEAGIKHQFDSTTNATFNMYTRKSEDVMVWQWVGPGAYDGKYKNVDTEKASGASATLSKLFFDHYTATIGYTYTHVNAQDGENANRNGQLPKNAFNLGLDYSKERFSANVAARGVSGREFRASDRYGDKQTSYWIVDMAANYEPFKRTKVFARINNLFDKYYTDRAYNADPALWYPQPGRNFQAGIEYTF